MKEMYFDQIMSENGYSSFIKLYVRTLVKIRGMIVVV